MLFHFYCILLDIKKGKALFAFCKHTGSKLTIEKPSYSFFLFFLEKQSILSMQKLLKQRRAASETKSL